ncbi:MAG: acyl CoA:acetate/3-ketoacid CoA transferase [Neomegalonema sp.]|nr:acyl CoA:acetate/3-ketoacid CoA transferase [Neomegalonema sp.]
MSDQKIVSAAEAVELIHSGDTITTSGFVGIGVPDALLEALATRRRETSDPRGLTLVFAAGQGDGATRGLNRLAVPGLLKRVIGGHWGLIPRIGAMALAGEIEAYNLPQGCISQLYRDSAAGKPGMLSRIGLGSFVDPQLEGGKINSATTEDLVERMTIGGEELLFYKAPKIDVALIRATTADERGALSMEREALVLDNLSQAMAAKNNGGVVIAQVERIAAARSLDPRSVIVPGALVDAIVVAEPEMHLQTYATAYSSAFAGVTRAPASAAQAFALDARKLIARRAAFELPINGVVNLGIGMPEGVAAVAREEGLLEHVTLTAEPGVIGGEPASGLDFGAAVNTDAVIQQAQQFDLYDGGGLDLACLGMAQFDQLGNVNVSRFGGRLAGAGGFINISQSARAVVYCGTLTSGGLDIAISEGNVRVAQDGRARKALEQVEQITFSGPHAAAARKPVLYVTERCVFELTAEGVRLSEIAPGVDLEQDILAKMDFRPQIDAPVEMDARLYREGAMDLKADLLRLDLVDRIALSDDGATLFLNFAKMRLRSASDVDMVRARVTELCAPLGRRVDAFANYDGARIDEDIEHAWWEMVSEMEAQYYGRVARYSAAAFMRLKIGKALSEAGVKPHLFDTTAAAQAYIK